MPQYRRNIQGQTLELELVEVDPREVRLDPTNPRIGYSMRQLGAGEQTDAACELLLISQEETEALKRSIQLSGGVQEPIYIRADGSVAEGNRRVVAMRAAQDEHEGDPRFLRMPAWQLPVGTPEPVIQNLLNEIHLGSVRGWAPYEKALQMKALVAGGLTENEVAERYRMSAREVRQQLAAVEMMDEIFFPIAEDPTDPENRTKFSYFLEFHKSPRLMARLKESPELAHRFSTWVKEGRVNTGARVRRLPKILDSAEATRLLEVIGFDAAEAYLQRLDPENQELYLLLERARIRMREMVITELTELAESPERQEILRGVRDEADRILSALPMA
jgi:hypothetical protein